MFSPVNIFISYVSADEALLKQFLSHLAGLEKSGLIYIWYDQKIAPGMDRSFSIKQAAQNADLIIPLVSADYIASDLLEKEGLFSDSLNIKAKCIPIILRECTWKFTPFSKLQVLPSPDTPVVHSDWGTTDFAFKHIVEKLITFFPETPLQHSNSGMIRNGVFTDPRDQQNYPVVKVSGKTWMAKNLNFKLEKKYRCYNDVPDNGKTFGGLYTWEGAQNACPEGWHISTPDDWQELIQYFGQSYSAYQYLINNTDSPISFSLGGKYSVHVNDYILLEDCGFYWTSKEKNFGEAVYYMFDQGMAAIRSIAVNKQTGASCRCVLNE